MNFKQIDLAGFKSFADKKEIKFENGITAIVGPNGCGKSNVADAIRWVLGEQSSKLLRGSSMQDVIFNGTEVRKSLSYCEVSLYFDNTKRFFNIDFDEVIITRKLYRSGESEYLINRTPCRLKDIVFALHDSGLGRDGYSIIGQGKVDEIINAKPENRRAIFEEAAGISKFKQRKVEAERKLERTQENLNRVQDVLAEQEKQLGPLKRQSENAKKAIELNEKLKHYEVNTYIYQYDNANDNKQKIQVRIDGILEALAIKQNDFENTNCKYNESMEEVGKIDKTLQGLNDKILNLTVKLEKRTGEANVIKERIKFLLDEENKLTAEVDRENFNKQNATISQEAAEAQKLQLQEKLAITNTELDSLTNEYLQVVDQLTSSEDEASKKQKEMIDELERLTDIKSNLSALKAQKDAYEVNLSETLTRLQQVCQKLDEKQSQYASAVGLSNEANLVFERLTNSLQEKQSQLDQGQQELSENTEKLVTLNNNVQIIGNRKKVLEDMQKDYEGYNYSVKRLMQDSEVNKELKNRIIGLVAGVMTIPSGFETAIEVALGGAVQDIITNNEEDSKFLINYLKNNNLGRATFLPIATMKPKFLSQVELSFTQRKNCYGVASQLVKFDKKLQNIFDSLLGRTVVVENIDDAVALARNSNFSFKIVTLDGDVINPQGSISGGSKKAITSNLLMRENEIETLTKQLFECEEKIKLVKTQTEQQKELVENLKKQTAELNSQLISAQVNKARQNQILDQFEVYFTELNKEKTTLSQEKSSIETKIEVITNAIQNVDNGDEGAKPALPSSELANQQKVFSALRAKRDDLHEQITNSKVMVANLESEISALDLEISRLAELSSATITKINALVGNLERVKYTISEARNLSSEKQDDNVLEVDVNEISLAKQELASLDGKKQKLQKEIKELDEIRTSLMGEINSIQEKKYQEDMNMQKVDSDLESMQERIFEAYELTYSTCLPYKTENYDLQEGLIETSKLKKEIAKLGYINFNAIEDCKLLLERFELTSAEVADLLAAKEDLIKVIKDLAVEMLSRFETEFTKIQTNFSQVFKELFGGGNAKLQLLESEDPLSAGVEIVAEPPGKKLQSITLLSGGEKALTAIAILFAILKLKPMPFCLLDEIEAALDESNVERFASYLKNFSRDTQFIVITHRKPTMVLADSLYGVTMEEKGVSTVVSVKLGEAVKNAKVG